MAKKKSGPNWIADALQHPGALKEQLGVAPDRKIPAKKLNKAASGALGPLAQKRANLAKTLRGLNK